MREYLPFRSLTTSNVCCRLAGFLAEARSAVWVLLSNCLSVGQVLCSIDNEYQCAYDWAINAHVRKDSRRVHPT